jgi:DNA repair photolyase
MAREAHHPKGRSSTTTGGERAGGFAAGTVRGRGSAINPANRFETISLAQLPAGGGEDDLLFENVAEAEQDERGDEATGNDAPLRWRLRPIVPTRVFRDRTRTIINPVDAPDLHFRWSINPYRGCEHGCVYCYARPTHETLGLSSGLDFESVLFAKVDGPRLLREELAKSSWKGEGIIMSGVTDAYQPAEARLGITRGCLEVMAACGQPVMIVTKSALVTRDIDLLSRLASGGAARVAISLTTLDGRLSASMEPRASSPQRRLAAMRELSRAGVPVTVMTAPIIPGLNDRELPALLEAAKEAGAKSAAMTLLRLPWQNKAIFLEWLTRHRPERASHVESLIRDTRGGALNDSRFGARMRGEGAIAKQIRQAFRIFKRKFGLDQAVESVSSSGFVRPDPERDAQQLRLFEKPI